MNRKFPAIIEEIRSYTEDVKFFRLSPGKKIPRFKAGQFLHFAIDKYDPSFNWPESRVFSIASSPTEQDHIDIIVSRKGPFTSRMIDDLKEGSEVWIKMPYGCFNFLESGGNDIVLVAGGTGISPFIPFLKELSFQGFENNISLFYGVRSYELLIIERIIPELIDKIQTFNYEIYIENVVTGINNIKFVKGVLPIKNIVNKFNKSDSPIFYLSGPEMMIKAFNRELLDNGFSAQNIRFDEWE